MEQTGARITDTLVSRSDAVANTFRENAEALVNALNNRGDAVKDMLAARLQAFEDMFNHGGTEIDREDLARLHDARQPDHPPHHRIRPYREDLWRRTGRTAWSADPGRVRGDAQLRRYIRPARDRPRRELTSTLDLRLSQFEELLGQRVIRPRPDLTDGGKRRCRRARQAHQRSRRHHQRTRHRSSGSHQRQDDAARPDPRRACTRGRQYPRQSHRPFRGAPG